MPTSYNQMPERRANLASAYEEVLTAAVRLRRGQSVSNEQVFRANAIASLDAAFQQAAAMGYATEGLEIADYAVTAFLDESVLNLKNAGFASWVGSPLNAERWPKFFHTAGDVFFNFMQQLSKRPDSVELADVLEVFCLCILLGYRGRYGSAGSGELSAIMRPIQEKILRSRGGTAFLSPLAQLPRDLPEPKAPDKWSKWLTWTAVSAAVLCLVVFVVWKLVLINGATQLQSLAGH
jgi:type VI secretion system protein ImpK